MRHEVPPELDGERLDLIVARLGGVSRGRARALVDAGEVLVEGRSVEARERLSEGTVLEIGEIEDDTGLEPSPADFEVRYQDPHLLVVDKPPGLVVHPGAGTSSTLASGLLHRYPEIEGIGDENRWGIVHRLDRDTSGLLLVALTQPAFDGLRQALSRRQIHRRYLALVLGVFSVPTGTIDAPIATDPARPTRRRVDALGRPARTHYRVIDSWDPPGVSLLDVTLETGRTHQIRVHVASIEHPVAGDRAYGATRKDLGAPRTFLHAARIAFTHPETGERLEVQAPLPADLTAVLEGLS